MSIKYDETAFMGSLLLDRDPETVLQLLTDDYTPETLKEDQKAMGRIVERLATQLSVISTSSQFLKKRDGDLENHLEKRFSLYENMLCETEFRRHSALYQYASRYQMQLGLVWEAMP